MKYLFFFFHMIQNQFCTKHIPCIMPEPLTISAVLHEFQPSGRSLDPLPQTCAPHYSLQPKCDPAVSLHLFSFSTVQHSHRDACCQQLHRCLTAVHNQQHFQAPFQEFAWQHVLPSPHYHESYNHQAKPSK